MSMPPLPHSPQQQARDLRNLNHQPRYSDPTGASRPSQGTEPSRPQTMPVMPQAPPPMGLEALHPNATLAASNFPAGTTTREVRSFFEWYAPVVHVEQRESKEDADSFCVTFVDQSSAQLVRANVSNLAWRGSGIEIQESWLAEQIWKVLEREAEAPGKENQNLANMATNVSGGSDEGKTLKEPSQSQTWKAHDVDSLVLGDSAQTGVIESSSLDWQQDPLPSAPSFTHPPAHEATMPFLPNSQVQSMFYSNSQVQRPEPPAVEGMEMLSVTEGSSVPVTPAQAFGVGLLPESDFAASACTTPQQALQQTPPPQQAEPPAWPPSPERSPSRSPTPEPRAQTAPEPAAPAAPQVTNQPVVRGVWKARPPATPLSAAPPSAPGCRAEEAQGLRDQLAAALADLDAERASKKVQAAELEASRVKYKELQKSKEASQSELEKTKQDLQKARDDGGNLQQLYDQAAAEKSALQQALETARVESSNRQRELESALEETRAKVAASKRQVKRACRKAARTATAAAEIADGTRETFFPRKRARRG